MEEEFVADSSPVFLNVHGNNAWEKGNPKKIDSNKLDTMKTYFQSGKYLNYILREEAALDVNVDPEQFDELMEIKAKQTKLWEDYKLSKGIIDEDHLTQEQFLMKSKLNAPVDAKIEELRANSPKFSGLHLLDPKTKEVELVSDDKIQDEYDSFNNIQPDKQNVWTGVMSFSDEFTEKIKGFTPAQIDKELAVQIPRMLKKSGWFDWEINQAKIGWAYHINTDNFHCHFYIYQPKPTRQYTITDKKTGKLIHPNKFIERFKINETATKDFRSQMDLNLSESSKAEVFKNGVKIARSWPTAFKGKIQAEVKEMYQRIAKDWTPDNKQYVKVLSLMKSFQRKHHNELKKYNSLGSLKTPEEFKESVFELEKQIIKAIPHYQTEFDKFQEINREHAKLKLERYMVYYKTPKKNGEMPEVDSFDMKIQAISPDDPKLNLSPEDYKAYKDRKLQKDEAVDERYNAAKTKWAKANAHDSKARFNKSWNDFELTEAQEKELYKDPYDWLKDKKIEFEFDELYSRHEKKGNPKGLEISFGNELVKMMQREIIIPRGKSEATTAQVKKSPSMYSPKHLTNRRLSNSAYQLKKVLNRIDQRMKKLELEAQKKFAQLQVDIEKAQAEEIKQWND